MPSEEHDQLLERLRQDDRTALRELFHQQYLAVCGAIRRLIPDQGLAEDLAQEVFIRFWEKRHQLHITSSLPGYLRRMAINEALAHLRRKKYYIEELTPQISGGEAADGEHHLLHSELEDQIRTAIDQLPPRCRLVFQLSRFEELTYQEIADQMEISIKTVENQMGKALRVLREQLGPYLSSLILLIMSSG